MRKLEQKFTQLDAQMGEHLFGDDLTVTLMLCVC